MKWITRERPKIDRIACPWLIVRFIDDAPEFLFVPSDKVLATAAATGAIPYDVPDVELSHDGALCSFDAFLKTYAFTDPALHHLAAIVRGADTGRPDLTPQSAGLLAISLGLSHNFGDDHEMLRHGLVMYDALYSWARAPARRDPRLAAGGVSQAGHNPIGPGGRKMLKYASIQSTTARVRLLRTEHWLALMTAVIATIATWRELSRSRRVLATLDDHQLRDIGLSRAEARLESEKPFWKPRLRCRRRYPTRP